MVHIFGQSRLKYCQLLTNNLFKQNVLTNFEGFGYILLIYDVMIVYNVYTTSSQRKVGRLIN